MSGENDKMSPWAWKRALKDCTSQESDKEIYMADSMNMLPMGKFFRSVFPLKHKRALR